MHLFLITAVILCEVTLEPPIFTIKEGNRMCEVTLSSTVDVAGVKIMSGSLSAKEGDFTPVAAIDNLSGPRHIIKINLETIKTPTKDILYSICIRTTDGDYLYSEPFRYDEKTNNYKLARDFNESFFDKYKIYIIVGASSLGVIGGGYLIYRKMRKPKAQDLL